MTDKACKSCKFISEGPKCPACNGEELTEKWSNYVYIEDAEKSELAKSIGAKMPGRYALNIKS